MKLGQKGVSNWERYRTVLSMTHRECGYWPNIVKPEHGCGLRIAISLIKKKLKKCQPTVETRRCEFPPGLQGLQKVQNSPLKMIGCDVRFGLHPDSSGPTTGCGY